MNQIVAASRGPGRNPPQSSARSEMSFRVHQPPPTRRARRWARRANASRGGNVRAGAVLLTGRATQEEAWTAPRWPTSASSRGRWPGLVRLAYAVTGDRGLARPAARIAGWLALWRLAGAGVALERD